METNFNDIEILAPAGNEEMLKASVFAGANSVYIGLDGFNARKNQRYINHHNP